MAIKKVTKKDTIKEAMEKDPELEALLRNEGLHCAGCPMANYETLEEGSLAHGLNPEEMIKKINKKLNPN